MPQNCCAVHTFLKLILLSAIIIGLSNILKDYQTLLFSTLAKQRFISFEFIDIHAVVEVSRFIMVGSIPPKFLYYQWIIFYSHH
jgi:hypothetical protein